MAEYLNSCPRCKKQYVFFDGADSQYSVGDIDHCPNCNLEVIIDWDGEEGTEDIERHLFWYT